MNTSIRFLTVVGIAIGMTACEYASDSMADAAADENGAQESEIVTEWLTSYEKAIEKSRETERPILMNFTGSDWCPPCISAGCGHGRAICSMWGSQRGKTSWTGLRGTSSGSRPPSRSPPTSRWQHSSSACRRSYSSSSREGRIPKGWAVRTGGIQPVAARTTERTENPKTADSRHPGEVRVRRRCRGALDRIASYTERVGSCTIEP